MNCKVQQLSFCFLKQETPNFPTFQFEENIENDSFQYKVSNFNIGQTTIYGIGSGIIVVDPNTIRIEIPVETMVIGSYTHELLWETADGTKRVVFQGFLKITETGIDCAECQNEGGGYTVVIQNDEVVINISLGNGNQNPGTFDQNNFIRIVTAKNTLLSITEYSLLEEKQTAIKSFLQGFEVGEKDILYFEIEYSKNFKELFYIRDLGKGVIDDNLGRTTIQPFIYPKPYDSYSLTNERLTGGTWTDGKPIYRKVFADLDESGSIEVLHNLNIETYIVRNLRFRYGGADFIRELNNDLILGIVGTATFSNYEQFPDSLYFSFTDPNQNYLNKVLTLEYTKNTVYNIELFGQTNKTHAVNFVRALTGLGLTDAVNFVNTVPPTVNIVENLLIHSPAVVLARTVNGINLTVGMTVGDLMELALQGSGFGIDITFKQI